MPEMTRQWFLHASEYPWVGHQIQYLHIYSSKTTTTVVIQLFTENVLEYPEFFHAVWHSSAGELVESRLLHFNRGYKSRPYGWTQQVQPVITKGANSHLGRTLFWSYILVTPMLILFCEISI